MRRDRPMVASLQTLVLECDDLTIPPSDDLLYLLETGLPDHLVEISLALPLVSVPPHNTTLAHNIMQVVMGAISHIDKVILRNVHLNSRICLPTKCNVLIIHVREDCPWDNMADDDAMSMIEREIGDANDSLKDTVIHFVEFGATFDTGGRARQSSWKRRLGKLSRPRPSFHVITRSIT
ncbi:hypothetical protein L202_03201 [Cryptococcus amylolentus CBS 6039]|uniref:Uncharacterized protein n=1 Tax=Cryptococcus amylolentus CBS 6039 TaxID=1295533 RepID=A0A1E3HXQ6_9TREE|nr:hypothetical protein L202_03201 [Cryptococcus amylolentus CBS 6039]ODN81108.1 hypothetical protein L202_03201 [Cryptococcus amylolentus CBS 6039]